LAEAFDELDFEYVSGVADKAMRAIAEQRVPPTPHNFHVWFKYALGAPVEHVSLYNCNFNFDSGQITVSYGINLKGPAAIGTADIALNESGGKRSFTQATFKDAAGKRTDLLAGGGI